MIDCYAAPTGNGLRATIVLAESGLPHKVHSVDIAKGGSRTAEFLKLNPAGAIPVIVDSEGPGGEPLTLSQSCAILLYVAEKCGRFMPRDAAARARTLQWTMMAASDVSGTNTALFLAINRLPDKTPANTEFWEKRLVDFLRVFDRQLEGRDFIVGSDVTVADFALFAPASLRVPLIEKAGLANLQRWFKAMSARPGVQQGLKLPA
jgi:GSH-dependent disulfide-bond oxidoreductase